MFTLFSNLINLTHLFCDNNKLTLLPSSLGNLINLKELNCSHNQIKELPNKVNRLSGCKLWRPETIINLKNIDKICKDTIILTPQQERYFNWINSKKSYNFDEHVDIVLVKCAYFGV